MRAQQHGDFTSGAASSCSEVPGQEIRIQKRLHFPLESDPQVQSPELSAEAPPHDFLWEQLLGAAGSSPGLRALALQLLC